MDAMQCDAMRCDAMRFGLVYRFDVEADGWNCGEKLVQVQFVQYAGLAYHFSFHYIVTAVALHRMIGGVQCSAVMLLPAASRPSITIRFSVSREPNKVLTLTNQQQHQCMTREKRIKEMEVRVDKMVDETRRRYRTLVKKAPIVDEERREEMR
jgi:hypothetical protein